MTESVLSELGAASTCQTCRLPSSVHVSAVGGVAVCLSSQMHVLAFFMFSRFLSGEIWLQRGLFEETSKTTRSAPRTPGLPKPTHIQALRCRSATPPHARVHAEYAQRLDAAKPALDSPRLRWRDGCPPPCEATRKEQALPLHPQHIDRDPLAGFCGRAA